MPEDFRRYPEDFPSVFRELMSYFNLDKYAYYKSSEKRWRNARVTKLFQFREWRHQKYFHSMFTVKELRSLARSYGLPVVSKMQKADLLRAIGEARAAEWRKRLRRALQTGRYPAITRGDIENPHKKWQRARELRQLAREVDTALLAEDVRKRTTPTMRAEARRKI